MANTILSFFQGTWGFQNAASATPPMTGRRQRAHWPQSDLSTDYIASDFPHALAGVAAFAR
jgi:hypothetical protein